MLTLAGSLQPVKKGGFANSVSNVLFVPVERKFPMIRVQTRQVRMCPFILPHPQHCNLLRAAGIRSLTRQRNI